uniref:Uncharacterized protein n=1 Tax=uncultured marine virus TaxID=186617 RepID=A0A0F7L066_9VIRU|nr:hypothetical protein [uncultured marine virus]
MALPLLPRSQSGGRRYALCCACRHHQGLRFRFAPSQELPMQTLRIAHRPYDPLRPWLGCFSEVL